ncbi:MAG TPA: P-type DNA transfer ATPase VirB11 [Hyphomonadaceae bacterium]|nr:P-type DNA transfer ATPase VirB11 [Hyphomonadaceae bacterium]HPN05725.1 P-type DNA transfer ATPase VirB11 [Hyphomonadaceae bacterium]
MIGEGVYLRTYLAPFAPWLDRADVTDILVNKPGEVWIDGAHGFEHHAAPDVTETMMLRLAQQIAAHTSQGVSREYPLLAATLPDGARVQIVSPPATRSHYALAIRKHVVQDLTLDNYEAAGAFNGAKRAAGSERAEQDQQLQGLLDRGELKGFFSAAVKAGRNIVISGGTGTGKTTFLNALLKEIPQSDRLIVIEDTPEVKLAHPNAVGLIAVNSELGEARVGIDELLRASLRMRPDRLMVGEIRGAEAFTFLRAVNTGHPGSLTTVHADSPQGAMDQIAFMTLQAGLTLTRADVIEYARSVIDVVVQLSRSAGKRGVSQVVFHRRA